MTVYGTSIIAGRPVRGEHGSTRTANPATGELLEPEFSYIGEHEVDRAASLASDAFDAYRATSPQRRAVFLETIADKLDWAKTEIVERASQESGLAVARMQGEHARTTGQLRAFAAELRLGAHQGVRIDHAKPDRWPVAAPDLRQRMIPLGPVVVFGASNFPLAFSTAGGDTASALAAGCPVIVKAHNSHAGAAELAGQAITEAILDCDLPQATFSLLFGRGTSIGQSLAAHPAVKAIAFTGSKAGGTALMRTAAARDQPIPVYAEMSSINPVILLPSALRSGCAEIADGFVDSLTLGSGQFCTNPGLVFVPEDDNGFAAAIARRLKVTVGQTMLSDGIHDAYAQGLERLRDSGVESIALGVAGGGKNAPAPAAFRTTAAHLRENPALQEEVFGAAALLVEYHDMHDLAQTLESLQGQLTISIHSTDVDYDLADSIIPLLERKAGRLVFNGWPTGVEVTHAMVHGGPYPATSDSRATSVGTLAIERFQRPISYQGFPDSVLPAAVQDHNPLHLPRRVNGTLMLD